MAGENEPITIDISTPDEPVKAEPSTDYGTPPDQKVQLVERRDRVPLGPPPDKEPPPQADEGPDLEQQLLALKQREKAARERATKAEQEVVQTRQQAQQHVATTQREKQQSDYYSVTNALAAKQAELNNVKVEYQTALANGDHAAASDINERMLDLRLDIRDLSSGKAEMERAAKEPPRQQPVQQQPQQVDIETQLAQMPNLMESERQWARKHPDLFTDQKQFKILEAAYLKWEKSGQPRGTPEYFKYFDQELGYTPDSAMRTTDDDYDDGYQEDPVPQPSQPRQRPAAAAPVSRSSPGPSSRDNARSNQITLTPQQREAARISKVDEKTYARNVARLRDLKRRGYYQETG